MASHSQGQEFIDSIDGVISDVCVHVAQILFGIESVQLSSSNQTVNGRAAKSAAAGWVPACPPQLARGGGAGASRAHSSRFLQQSVPFFPRSHILTAPDQRSPGPAGAGPSDLRRIHRFLGSSCCFLLHYVPEM